MPVCPQGAGAARRGPLGYLQDAGGALAPQGAQDEPPAAGAGGGADGVLPGAAHALVAVVLLREDLAVGIVPVEHTWAQPRLDGLMCSPAAPPN